MRIITLSDLHVRHGATLPETLIALAWILACLRALPADQQPDLILLGGDLFDTAATAEALLALCGFVQEAASICEVVILYGNHERQRELDVLARLSARFPITVYAKPAVHRIPGLALALIPWLDRVLPIADLAGYSLEQEKAAEEKRLNEILDALRAELDAVAQPGDARVCAGHLMLDVAIGALANPGQPDPKGKEFLVSLAQLARLGCQAYALGHVHDGREWTVPGRSPGDASAPVYYNGSTRSWGWGEIKGKRYVEINEGGDATIPARIAYNAIPGRAMIQLDDAWVPGPEASDRWGWKLWTGVAGELDDGEAVNALVRYSYEVPASRADEARAAAAAVEKELYGAGAHQVKLDPRVQPEQRPRRPEMAAAKTLEDKLDVYVVGRGIDPTEEHVVRARRNLSALRQETGIAGQLAAGGARLRSIETSGMRAFPETVRLDIDALPGTVVAMVGECGAGKSTLLACWREGMHRVARDDIRRLAEHDQNGVLCGGVIISRIDIEGETWRLEHHLARDKAFAQCETADRPVTSGLTAFREWAEGALLPLEVMDASIFAGQGERGLLDFKPNERRPPMLKALGLGPLKALYAAATAKAKEAGKKAAEASGVLAGARARLDALPAPAAAGVVEAARAEALRLEAEVERLDVEERRARATEEMLAFAVTAAADTRRALTNERARSAAALRGLEEQLAEHHAVLARAGEIRAADAQAVDLRAEIVRFDAAIAAGNAATSAAARARDAALVIENEATSAIDRLVKKLSGAATILAGRAKVEVAAAMLAYAEENLAVATAKQADAQRNLAEAQRETAERAITRAGDLRQGIDKVKVSATIEGAHAVADGAAEVDDRRISTKHDFEALDNAYKLAFGMRADCEVAARLTRELAAKLPEITRADEDTAAWTAEKARLESVRDDAHVDGMQHELARLDAVSARLAAEKSLITTRERLAPLEAAAALAGALARAEASADTLSAPIADRRSELEGIEQRIADLPPAPAAQVGATAADLLADLRRAQEGVARARATVKGAEDAASARQAAEDALSAAKAAAVDPAAEEAAWNLLVAFLGPKGLQTIEIDVACPELSAILHELLGCHGSRWSMSCEATRPTKDGGEVAEILFPTIDNTSKNLYPRDAKGFSGGQSIPLSFAIRLAVAMLVVMRTGTVRPTLVLDEPTAGLHSVADYEAIMAMIRRASALIGAGKVIVVSHTREVVELCDCAIVVGGGKLEVISPARIPDAA